jgi:hypothetical protein
MNLPPSLGPWTEVLGSGSITLTPSTWTDVVTLSPDYNPPAMDGWIMEIRLSGAAQNNANASLFSDLYVDTMAVMGT